MVYFKIEKSINLKEIGTYPQAQNIINPTGEFLPTEKQPRIWNLNFWDELPENTYCSIHAIAKRAKLTDLVSYVANDSFGLLISDKLKVILEQYLSDQAQLIKNPIFYKNEIIKNYWLLHFYKFGYKNIDFSKTVIWRKLSFFENDYRLPVKDERELIHEIEKHEYPNGYGISIESISFLDGISDDFFALRYVSGGIGYFISERLKSKIEANGCTGIRFMGINEEL